MTPLLHTSHVRLLPANDTRPVAIRVMGGRGSRWHRSVGQQSRRTLCGRLLYGAVKREERAADCGICLEIERRTMGRREP
jgi:hypothetical protein